jgi:LacI family transcriptional regulator
MPLAFDGAREKALEYGISITLSVTRGEDVREDAAFDHVVEQPLLGLIYGTVLTRVVDPPKILFERPSVLLNCYDSKRRLTSVLPAELLGGRTATERLIMAGRRRVGLINGQDGIDASRDRLRGYRQALSSNDIPFDSELVYPGLRSPGL